MKKSDFERMIPATPDSFHEMIERTLRRTEEESYMKRKAIRPAIAILAALIVTSMVGGALAVGSHLGLWDFAKNFTGRTTPSDTAPQSEWLGQTVSDDHSIFTLLEAYYEGSTINVLSEMADAEGVPYDGGFVFVPVFTLGEGIVPDQTTEHQIVDGTCLFYTTIVVPEGSPDTLTLTAEGPVQETCTLSVTRAEGAQTRSGIRADHTTIAGTGITFTDFLIERTALNCTLTLDYTYDTSAITPPELPSCYLDYFTADGAVYHADRECEGLSGSIRQCAYGEIAAMSPCTLEGCNPMAGEFGPEYDGLYLELTDARGEVLPFESVDSSALIGYDPAAGSANGLTGSGQVVFWIDAESIPEEIGLRIYDAWTKHRWKDTVTLILPQE